MNKVEEKVKFVCLLTDHSDNRIEIISPPSLAWLEPRRRVENRDLFLAMGHTDLVIRSSTKQADATTTTGTTAATMDGVDNFYDASNNDPAGFDRQSKGTNIYVKKKLNKH